MNMETKIDLILKIVTINQQDIAELKQDVAALKQDVAVLKEDVRILKQYVAQLKEDVAQLKQDVISLNARVSSLERSVFLIETEHGDKINALFDAAKANEDAHKRIEQAIEDLRSEIQGILFNHEKRISKLEGNLVPSF